jgi:hypothetical protein
MFFWGELGLKSPEMPASHQHMQGNQALVTPS